MSTVETRKPPIEMRHHFFPSIHLEADHKVADLVKDGSEVGYEYKIDLKVGDYMEEPGIYPLQLTVETCEMQGKIKGYDAKITAVGYVAIAPNTPEDKKMNLVTVNGGSLLYSATREYLYSLSLRGPFPPLYLPTISFRPKEEEPAAPPAKAKASSKAKK